MTQIYEKLRARLDDLATGYPATESKIEIRLLERLFTEEEAELYLQLSPLLQKPVDVAQSLGRDPEEIAGMMEHMAQKGLLFRKRKGDLVRYSAVPYVVGIFEHQLARMDEAFARDHEEYFETAFGRTIQSFKTPVLAHDSDQSPTGSELSGGALRRCAPNYRQPGKDCRRPLRLPDNHQIGRQRMQQTGGELLLIRLPCRLLC